MWWFDLLVLRCRVIHSYLGMLRWHRELWNAGIKPLIVIWSFYVSWRKKNKFGFYYIIYCSQVPEGLLQAQFSEVKSITKNIFVWSIVLEILHHWSCWHEFKCQHWLLGAQVHWPDYSNDLQVWTLSHFNTQTRPFACWSNIAYWFQAGERE